MTTEDRLREALASTAALVHLDDEPETVPARAPRRIGRYAPLAVAAAVLVVLAGVVFGLHGEGDPAPAVSLGPAAPARYFLAKIGSPGTVTVRDIQTGRVTATVTPPDGRQWQELSATADPHVFYATATRYGSPTGRLSLYRLTIDATGRVRARTDIRVLPRDDLIGFSAAPDGRHVAFGVVDRGTGPAAIEVITVASGRRAVYRTSTAGYVSDLSWAADSRHLAFQLITQADYTYSVRILDTRAGHDLLRDSRPVLAGGRSYLKTYAVPVLGADGRHVYLLATVVTKGHRSIQVLEFDARTGRRLRVMYEQPNTGKSGDQTWLFHHLARDPTGTMLLVVDPNGRAHRIDIASRRVTSMPFPGGVPNAFTW